MIQTCEMNNAYFYAYVYWDLIPPGEVRYSGQDCDDLLGLYTGGGEPYPHQG